MWFTLGRFGLFIKCRVSSRRRDLWQSSAREVVRLSAEMVATTHVPVLRQGQSGTGGLGQKQSGERGRKQALILTEQRDPIRSSGKRSQEKQQSTPDCAP